MKQCRSATESRQFSGKPLKSAATGIVHNFCEGKLCQPFALLAKVLDISVLSPEFAVWRSCMMI